MPLPFVDRIEGPIAVLVIEGHEERRPLASLPGGVREGVYLSVDLQRIEERATAEAIRSVAERRARLTKDDDGGDFSL
jgi:hypothetical protein